MGYKPVADRPTKITYTDYPGLEVYATTPDMGELMDMADMKLNLNDAAEKRMRAFDFFAEYITSWNVDHPAPKRTRIIESNDPNADTSHDLLVCARCGLAEDNPLPSTAEHMMCLNTKFIMPVFFGWLSTVSRVDPQKFLPMSSGGNNIQEDLMRQLAEMQNPMPFSEPNLS